MAATCYADTDISVGYYQVIFIIRETGQRLMRGFDSPYLARKFVNKLKHSKRCILVSYPNFD